MIRGLSTETLTTALDDNKTLRHLKLSWVKLSSKSINDLRNFINENYNLKHLDLSWNEIRMFDMIKLTDTLGQVSNIQYLSLAAIPISGQNAEKMLQDICQLMVIAKFQFILT